MGIARIDKCDNRIYEAVCRLIPQLNPDAAIPSKIELRELIESGHTYFFVAETEGKIAGMATLITYTIPTGKKYWIEDVIVDNAHRNKGIGCALVSNAIKQARLLGAKEVRLTSRPGRMEANKLYRKMGFIPYETNVYKYLIP